MARRWQDVDWREHQRWATVDGRAVNYVELGSGPPILFVHGLGGCWQNWLENLLAFAGDHRVVAVDLPGFGFSEMPREKISISGYGVFVDRFCEEVGIDAATFVGNSMGGFVSAECAIKFPHRVERLVLVAAAGISTGNFRSERLLKAMYVGESVAQWVTARVVGRSRELAGRPRGRQAIMWFVTPRAAGLSPELVIEQARGAGKPGFLQALDALTDYPIRDRLGEVRAPTLVVWGEKDLLVPVEDAEVFHELVPDSRLVVYEDTGHVPMLERPERFNADMRRFLAEQPDEAGERERAAEARGGERAAAR
ncbi:MAG TPA: alpha/beta hydrolase [Solirubrobacteraceae bacterium]|nr:alpha/beta hydrolase [Solirubrobacteraceae bacterium]